MSSLTPIQNIDSTIIDKNLKSLYIIGGVAALLQLATLLAMAVVMATLGPKPTSAEEYFMIQQNAAATTDAMRAQFLAAGEALIASGVWHSSGAYMSGILLQGAGVMISVIMLRSRDFSRVTAYAGLVGNALDLTQHILHPFVPAISKIIQMVMGPFYMVWFPMLGRDLIRLGLNLPNGRTYPRSAQ